jgi:ATP-dependent DNA ligase
MLPAEVTPQLVDNRGQDVLRLAPAEPERYAIEPKVDGVRGLIVYRPDGRVEARNRLGRSRDWFRHPPFSHGIRALAERLPILWEGTVVDGELTAGRFAWTMAAIYGSREHEPNLRFVVFDVPVLAGVDPRSEPWEARRDRLDLLARAFEAPFELSPMVGPPQSLVAETESGRLEGSCSRTAGRPTSADHGRRGRR